MSSVHPAEKLKRSKEYKKFKTQMNKLQAKWEDMEQTIDAMIEEARENHEEAKESLKKQIQILTSNAAMASQASKKIAS